MNRSLNFVARHLCHPQLRFVAPRTPFLLNMRAASSSASAKAPTAAAVCELRWGSRRGLPTGLGVGAVLDLQRPPIMFHVAKRKRGRPTKEEMEQRKTMIKLDLQRRHLMEEHDAIDNDAAPSPELIPKHDMVESSQVSATSKPRLTPKAKKNAGTTTTDRKPRSYASFISGILAGIGFTVIVTLNGQRSAASGQTSEPTPIPVPVKVADPTATPPAPETATEVATETNLVAKSSATAAPSQVEVTPVPPLAPEGAPSSPSPPTSVKPWQYLPWISIRLTLRLSDFVHGIYTHLIQIWLPWYYVERVLLEERERERERERRGARGMLMGGEEREGPKEMRIEVKYR